MQDAFNQFFAKYNGVGSVGDTPENTGQCVGLIEVWTDYLGLPHTWGNADDLLNDADPNSFSIILNSASNVPQIGDVIVFSGNFNKSVGHTGISTGVGDASTFEMFQQNDPLGSVCHNRTYNYQYVLGWMRAKNPKFPSSPTAPSTDPDLTDKAVQFDKSVSALNQKGLLPTNDSNNYIHNDGFVNEVNAVLTERDELIGKATKWDQVCNNAGLKGDSSTFTPEQVAEGFAQLNAQALADAVSARDSNKASYDSEVAANAKQATQIQDLQTNLNDSEGQVKELTDTNAGLKSNISQVQVQNSNLLLEVAAAKTEVANYQKTDSTAIDQGIEFEQKYNALQADMTKLAQTMGTTYPPIANLVNIYQAQVQASQKQANFLDKFAQIIIGIFTNKK